MVKHIGMSQKENFMILIKIDDTILSTNKLIAYVLKAQKEGQTYNFGSKLKYTLKGNNFSVKSRNSKSKLYKEIGFKTEYSKLKSYRFFFKKYQISIKEFSSQAKPGTFTKIVRLFSNSSKAEFNNVDTFDSKSEFESESDDCKFHKTRFNDDEVDFHDDDK